MRASQLCAQRICSCCIALSLPLKIQPIAAPQSSAMQCNAPLQLPAAACTRQLPHAQSRVPARGAGRAAARLMPICLPFTDILALALLLQVICSDFCKPGHQEPAAPAPTPSPTLPAPAAAFARPHLHPSSSTPIPSLPQRHCHQVGAHFSCTVLPCANHFLCHLLPIPPTHLPTCAAPCARNGTHLHLAVGAPGGAHHASPAH